MGISIGLLEVKSIPAGIQTADEMLKAANVTLLMASPTCPGKYVIVVSGAVGAVKSAMNTGRQTAGVYLVAHQTINNVHDSIPAAVLGTTEVEHIKSIGVVETISAITAIRAGDIAAKAGNVSLMEVRIARGLGGKGYLTLTGEVAAVKAAVNSCLNDLEDTGEIINTCVIPSPHPDLICKLM